MLTPGTLDPFRSWNHFRNEDLKGMHDDLLRAETGLPDVSYVCACRPTDPRALRDRLLTAPLLLRRRRTQSSTSVRASPLSRLLPAPSRLLTLTSCLRPATGH